MFPFPAVRFVFFGFWQGVAPLTFFSFLGLGSNYIRDCGLGWCFAYIQHLVIVPFLARCILRRLVLIILVVSKTKKITRYMRFLFLTRFSISQFHKIINL